MAAFCCRHSLPPGDHGAMDCRQVQVVHLSDSHRAAPLTDYRGGHWYGVPGGCRQWSPRRAGRPRGPCWSTAATAPAAVPVTRRRVAGCAAPGRSKGGGGGQPLRAGVGERTPNKTEQLPLRGRTGAVAVAPPHGAGAVLGRRLERLPCDRLADLALHPRHHPRPAQPKWAPGITRAAVLAAGSAGGAMEGGGRAPDRGVLGVGRGAHPGRHRRRPAPAAATGHHHLRLQRRRRLLRAREPAAVGVAALDCAGRRRPPQLQRARPLHRRWRCRLFVGVIVTRALANPPVSMRRLQPLWRLSSASRSTSDLHPFPSLFSSSLELGHRDRRDGQLLAGIPTSPTSPTFAEGERQQRVGWRQRVGGSRGRAVAEPEVGRSLVVSGFSTVVGILFDFVSTVDCQTIACCGEM